MSRARRKSPYDSIENLVNKKLQLELDRLESDLKRMSLDFDPSNTTKHYDTGKYSVHNLFDVPSSASKDVKPPLKIVDETTILDISKFTKKTHQVVVRLENVDFFDEKKISKVIGKENVEWWEYVLGYGFYKAIKTAINLSIDGIMKEKVKTVKKNKYGVCVSFHPKSSGEHKRELVNMGGGKYVDKLIGVNFLLKELKFNLSYVERNKITERIENYLVYEDKTYTFEHDFDVSLKNIESKLKEVFLDIEFRNIIYSEIYGRLRNI